MPGIGLISGTGDLGTALAVHLAKRHDVLLGSRSVDKAKTAVDSILVEKGSREYLFRHLKPAQNLEVVSNCDVLLLTVPHENAVETVRSLVGSFHGTQVLISTAAAVAKVGEDFRADFGKEDKSISQQIKEVAPPTLEIATAFQTVPANRLYKEMPISADVLVAADKRETYETVAEIVRSIEGLRPLYLGTLKVSSEIERLTVLLLNLAKRNNLKSPTIKFNSF